jgi:hypothetical protein
LRLLQSRVLRRILGPKRQEVTGITRKVKYIIRHFIIPDLHQYFKEHKSWRMRWMGHAACMGELIMCTKF